MDNEKKMVLACIDGSKLSEAVCDYASWVARRLNIPLKLINTIDHHQEVASMSDLSGNLGFDSRDHLLEEITDLEHKKSKLRIQQGKAILENAKQRVIERGCPDPVTCLQHGSLIESLIELEKDTHLIVVGARGKIHENRQDQIGAKLEGMIRSLHTPILVAYEKFKTPETIMIAYDGGEAANKAVDMVSHSPLYHGLVCHLVCVSNKASADEVLEKAVNKLRQAGNIETISASLRGTAEKELCEYQVKHNIDMTIMGAFSHTRLHDLLLGSFTVKMLFNTKKPLLLLR